VNAGLRIQDRYTLTDLLGTGGMAEVWRAHDERLERDVAVKLLRSHLAEDPEFNIRFLSEAQSVARINHPNVVSVLDFGRSEEAPYLVMELVPGGALSEMTGAPLLPERALELVGRAARGVGAAHELDVVHRDIKPQNILLDHDGQAKITDFGIASAHGQESLTATGTAIGSPHYISPEQVSGDRQTPRSDVYSLGVVLYELLAGVKPFDGDNVTAVAIAHVDRTPEPPSAHNADVDAVLDALVLRCMAKDPAERFDDGNALAAEIESVLAGGPAIVPPPAPLAEPDTGEILFESDRKSGLFVAVLIAALLVAGAAAALIGGRADTPPATASVPESSPSADRDGRKRPSPRASVDSAPVAEVATSPSAAVAPEEEPPEPAEGEEPERVHSGGSSSQPEEEPTPEPVDEPTPEPTEEPTPEPTPETDTTPESSNEDGGTEG
jgi:serine/threonine-protein kinase